MTALNTIWLGLLVTLTFAFTSSAHAFPRHDPVPGGIAVIPLVEITEKRPIVHYQQQRVTVVPHQGKWTALVGIPLKARDGQHTITARHPVTGSRHTLPFSVRNKHYRTQRLTIKNKNKVNPNQQSMQRIIRELAVQKDIKTRFSETETKLSFRKPVRGRDTGRFGLKRFINNQPRNPHSGMDIAAAKGTPIVVTAPGRVLHTDDFFFSGNVVYVDHGSGVISLYAHLDKIGVRVGQWLDTGSIVGTVGSTGRATGPHLHWSVYLNGEAVNPALFL